MVTSTMPCVVVSVILVARSLSCSLLTCARGGDGGDGDGDDGDAMCAKQVVRRFLALQNTGRYRVAIYTSDVTAHDIAR